MIRSKRTHISTLARTLIFPSLLFLVKFDFPLPPSLITFSPLLHFPAIGSSQLRHIFGNKELCLYEKKNIITLKVCSFSHGCTAGCFKKSANGSTPAPSGLLASGPRRSAVPPVLCPAPEQRPTRTTHATSHSSRDKSVVDSS